tara:strand:+ start:1 stop:969 length:969 start_codon:yes stop_codon:yes gene_type:complete
MIVSNTTVAPLYIDKVESALAGFKVSRVILPDGEQYKNLEILNQIFNALLEEGHNRTTTLIALGGGVIGDMTGFAAASYQRGVNFIQIPTTLLSQVDSSVGGKTGVNHVLGKNMIGAFYQPQAVVIDIDTLQSLQNKELAAGMAEVIKYGLISDAPFYHWLTDHMGSLLERDHHLMAEAIHRSCENKARVVSVDEREGGVRALLNLGHTFGHAIETALGYGQWLHGEAVAVGMVLAMQLSVKLGKISDSELSAFKNLLIRLDLPVYPPASMTSERFLELMAVDKKVVDGTLRLVVLDKIGQARVSSDIEPTLIAEVIDEALS